MPVYYDNMDLSANEKQRFAICAIALGMTTGLLFYDSPAAGVLLTLCCGFYLPVYKRNLTEKKKSQLLLQFRDLLYSISSSVSAGRTVAQALEESVDFWKATYEEKDYIMQELAYMNGHIQKGGEKDIDVLKDFAKRSGLEDISDFVSVYESCRMTGGNLAQGINRATTIIGDKITLERELRKYGIRIRTLSEQKDKYKITKDFLSENLKIKSQAELSRELGCAPSLISKYKKKFNL